MTVFSALELSVLFVCIWGFIAIMMTGQFAMGVVLVCVIVLIAGYFFRRNGWKPSQLSANIAAILVMLMTLGIFASTFNLLSATVHLFLFLQVTKYITRRSLGEIRWCYLISLFNIIGASVITTTFTFGLVLVVYIFLALVSLRLFVIAREFERNSLLATRASQGRETVNAATVRGRSSRVEALAAVFSGALYKSRASRASLTTRLSLSQMRLPRAMISSGLALTFVTMGLSGALFSVIPRLATQNLFQNYGQVKEESNVSAFSENVEFGSFTEIQLDNSIALFVEPEDTKNRPRYVRMRGVALDIFDGKAWRRGGGSFAHSGEYDYSPVFTTRLYPQSYKFRVLQPAGLTTFLFGDSFPVSIDVPKPYLYQVDRMSQSIWLTEAPPKEFQYEVKSMQEDLLLRRDPTTLKLERPPAHLVPRVRVREPESDEDSVDAVMRFFGDIEEFIASPYGNDTGDDETSESSRRRFRETRYAGDADNSPLYRDPMRERRGRFRDDSETSRTGNDDETSRGRDRDYDRGGVSDRYGRRFRQRPRTGQEMLYRYLERCLELPENLSKGRVSDLAKDWTEDSKTTFAKAMAIETRLRTGYEYSLTPRATGNYIESFLFDVREGHCEYFATSMAVLLRDIGIPARIVNGFYSTEWNPLSSNFTVRQKDAHSWVEAWMGDNYGWMTFDPTPPGGVARRIDRGAIVEAMSRMSDAIRMRWYRYVIDYSFSDQVSIIRYLSRVRQNIVNAIKQIRIPGIIGSEAKTIEQNGLTDTIDWRPIAVSGAIIFLLLGWQVARWIARRRRPQFSVVHFYDDLLKALARRGITIQSGETPREFARRVAGMRSDWGAFANATDWYYQKMYRPNQTHSHKASAKKGHYGLTGTQLDELVALKKAISRKQDKRK